jgi:hypothetical protein
MLGSGVSLKKLFCLAGCTAPSGVAGAKWEKRTKDLAMPRGASPKREREYNELKGKFHEEGRYEGREEEVAARIVNKQRAEKGETKQTNDKKKSSGTKAKDSSGTAEKSSSDSPKKAGTRKKSA